MLNRDHFSENNQTKKDNLASPLTNLAMSPTSLLPVCPAASTLSLPEDNFQTQAAQLNNPRIGLLQRQGLAAHIAQTHGNMHMQHLIQRARGTNPRPSESIQRRIDENPDRLNNQETDLMGENASNPPPYFGFVGEPHREETGQLSIAESEDSNFQVAQQTMTESEATPDNQPDEIEMTPSSELTSPESNLKPTVESETPGQPLQNDVLDVDPQETAISLERLDMGDMPLLDNNLDSNSLEDSPTVLPDDTSGPGEAVIQQGDGVTDQLTRLRHTPLSQFKRVTDEVEGTFPDIAQNEQTTIRETLPPEFEVPTGLPTLEEMTGRSQLPSPQAQAETIKRAITHQQSPITPDEPPSHQPDHNFLKQSQEFDTQAMAQRQAMNETQQAQNPGRVTIREHVSTSAGPRPNVDLSTEANPDHIRSHQQTANQETANHLSLVQGATEAHYGERAIYPLEKPDPIPRDLTFPQPTTPDIMTDLTEWSAQAPELVDTEVDDLDNKAEARLHQQDDKISLSIQQASEGDEVNENIKMAETMLATQETELNEALTQSTHQENDLVVTQNLQAEQTQLLDQAMNMSSSMTPGQSPLLNVQTQNEAEVAQLDQTVAQTGQHNQFLTDQLTEQQNQAAELSGIIDLGDQKQAENESQLKADEAKGDELVQTASQDFESLAWADLERRNASQIEEQIDTLSTVHQTSRAEKLNEVDQTWRDVQGQMTDYTAETKDQQTQVQLDAQTAVTTLKEDWRTQNATLYNNYQTQATTLSQTANQTLQQKVQTAEREADAVMTKAETEARTHKAEAESQASNLVGQAREQAADKLAGAGLPLNQTYEATAVDESQTIMRVEAQDADAEEERRRKEEEAKQAAIEALKAAAEAARRILEIMAEMVQKLLTASKEEAAAIMAHARQEIIEVIETHNLQVETLKDQVSVEFQTAFDQAIGPIDEIIEFAKTAVYKFGDLIVEKTLSLMAWGFFNTVKTIDDMNQCVTEGGDATIHSIGMTGGYRLFGVGPVIHSTFDLVTTEEGEVQLFYTRPVGYFGNKFREDIGFDQFMRDTIGLNIGTVDSDYETIAEYMGGGEPGQIFPQPDSFLSPQIGVGYSKGCVVGSSELEDIKGYGATASGGIGLFELIGGDASITKGIKTETGEHNGVTTYATGAGMGFAPTPVTGGYYPVKTEDIPATPLGSIPVINEYATIPGDKTGVLVCRLMGGCGSRTNVDKKDKIQNSIEEISDYIQGVGPYAPDEEKEDDSWQQPVEFTYPDGPV